MCFILIVLPRARAEKIFLPHQTFSRHVALADRCTNFLRRQLLFPRGVKKLKHSDASNSSHTVVPAVSTGRASRYCRFILSVRWNCELTYLSPESIFYR